MTGNDPAELENRNHTWKSRDQTGMAWSTNARKKHGHGHSGERALPLCLMDGPQVRHGHQVTSPKTLKRGVQKSKDVPNLRHE